MNASLMTAPEPPQSALGIPPLERALEYELDDVIYKFVDYYDVPFETASEFFRETRKWLWLCARAAVDRGAPDLSITAPLFWLDEMWHIFLQFTGEYQEFCAECCGAFVHHAPTPHSEKVALRESRKKDPEAFLEERASALRAQCTYIRDHLGEDTLRLWYCDFAKEYSAERLQDRSLRRKSVV